MADEQVDTNVSTEQTPDGGADKQPEKQTEKTFTQAEVNAITRDRLAREKAKFADYDDLKALAEAKRQEDDAKKSELEKLQTRLAELEATTKEKDTLLKAEKRAGLIAKIAGQLGGIDPYDANFVLATQSIEPDGQDAEVEITRILTGLKEAKPYLFRSKAGGVEPFNPGSASGAAEKAESRQHRLNRIMSGGGSIWESDLQGGVTFAHPEDAKNLIPTP